MRDASHLGWLSSAQGGSSGYMSWLEAASGKFLGSENKFSLVAGQGSLAVAYFKRALR